MIDLPNHLHGEGPSQQLCVRVKVLDDAISVYDQWHRRVRGHKQLPTKLQESLHEDRGCATSIIYCYALLPPGEQACDTYQPATMPRGMDTVPASWPCLHKLACRAHCLVLPATNTPPGNLLDT